MAFSLKDINSFVREGYRGRNPDIRYEQDYRGSWSSDEKKGSHSPSIPGFGFRTSKTGRLSWVLDYRPYSLDPATGEYRPVRRYRRMKLGDYPSMTLEKAKRKAEMTRAKIMSGIDPLEKSAQDGLTLQQWAKLYLQDKRSKDFRSSDEMERRIDRHIVPALGHKRLVDIATSDVYDLHKKIGEGPRKPRYEAKNCVDEPNRDWQTSGDSRNNSRGKMKADPRIRSPRAPPSYERSTFSSPCCPPWQIANPHRR